MNPIQLSHELRLEQTDDLNRRRWLVGLSLVGATLGQVVSLYQLGIIKHLPDPPIPYIDSEKVDASAYAYKRFDIPDALLMLVNYGVTAALAGAGGKNRAETNPALPVAMGVKMLADTALNIQLAREEWKDNKALCFYCQTATVVSIASVALAVPEVVKAVRKLFGR
ncbi:vitamin K epoxide reductase family protein [Spirosoma aerophilum]